MSPGQYGERRREIAASAVCRAWFSDTCATSGAATTSISATAKNARPRNPRRWILRPSSGEFIRSS
jgi:hypothetical protein